MQVSQYVGCTTFPCPDVQHASYAVPDIDLAPEKVSIILVSEAAPESRSDGYYAGGSSLFQQTTLLAFNDAGAGVTTIQELLDLGVYLTTAVKCAKTAYGIQTGTVKACSLILQQELSLFPNVRALLLMGDVAIKAVNVIAQRSGRPRVVPAVSTYKLRGEKFDYQGVRVFPSYLQAGPSFFIEKSKRKMIAEDLAAALALR